MRLAGFWLATRCELTKDGRIHARHMAGVGMGRMLLASVRRPLYYGTRSPSEVSNEETGRVETNGDVRCAGGAVGRVFVGPDGDNPEEH